MARDESNTSEKIGSFGLYPKKVPAPVACAAGGMRFFPSMGYPAGGSKREGPWLHSYWHYHSLLASPLKFTWLGR